MNIPLRRRHTLMVEDGAFSHKIDFVTVFFRRFKISERIAIAIQYWFKSYSDFAEGVDFAYWWSFNGGGSAAGPPRLV